MLNGGTPRQELAREQASSNVWLEHITAKPTVLRDQGKQPLAQRISQANCKAGALPAELHPRFDLRFCVAPRFMQGSTALQQHHNSSARLDGGGAVGGRWCRHSWPRAIEAVSELALRLSALLSSDDFGSRVEREARGQVLSERVFRMPWEHGGALGSVHWRARTDFVAAVRLSVCPRRHGRHRGLVGPAMADLAAAKAR
jgi:hypothetical protein